MRSDQEDTTAGAAPSAPILHRPPHALIDSVRRHLQMSEEDVRIAYWACGGNVPGHELSAFLAGECALSDGEYNTLAAAMNDKMIEGRLEPSIPYAED